MVKHFKFENSAMLNSCSYDEDKEELEVMFTGGKTYTYVDVGKDIYISLINATSAGKYFNSIKKDLKQK